MTIKKCLLAGLWAIAWPAAAHAFDPIEASIHDLQLELEAGRMSSVELVDFYLARIDKYDGQGPNLNSMAALNPAARDEAAALDLERAAGGARGPLHGIPLVVKDNYETRGMPTTAGSAALRGFMPDRDAELVERLRAAGAIILGKTNMHEFAYGIESIGSAFGVTRNPYDPARNPGGSSGGTGAAVAANFAVAGLGSDTCGSIRIPAAHNALVGLRGTQGASSRDGIVPLSGTQDIGGPLARSVTDLALLLDVVVGYDPDDPQSAASVGHFEAGFIDALEPGALDGKRIGVVSELRYQGPDDAEVASVFDAATAQLAALGATVETVSLPVLNDEILKISDGYYLLVHDVARHLGEYLAQRPEAPLGSVQEIIDSGQVHPQVLGRLQSSVAIQGDPEAIYLGEFRKRSRLRAAILETMAANRLDALVYPTMRRVAVPVGEEQSGETCHLAANSGLPAITVPAGFSATGMPVGLELLGRPWDDARLLGLAYAFEQATRHRRPPGLGE